MTLRVVAERNIPETIVSFWQVANGFELLQGFDGLLALNDLADSLVVFCAGSEGKSSQLEQLLQVALADPDAVEDGKSALEAACLRGDVES
eukprot:2122317-Prymnesium_polylepis.1